MQSSAPPNTLPVGYSAVPPGHVATVVTSLEMRSRPAPPAVLSWPPGYSLEPLVGATPERYRALYRLVGEDWLWFSRLVMPDDELRSILNDTGVHVFSLRAGERDAGILELDFRRPDDCELAFFGLAPGVIGKGIGRTLMNKALERAWSQPIKRLWVHTCTLDHPAALGFYQRSGFVAYRTQVEILPDRGSPERWRGTARLMFRSCPPDNLPGLLIRRRSDILRAQRICV